MRERDIEQELVQSCRKRGFLCYKFVSPGHNGVPDRIVIAQGHVRFVELKAPGMKPRANQRYIHQQFAAHQCPVTVIDSMEHVARFLDDLESLIQKTSHV